MLKKNKDTKVTIIFQADKSIDDSLKRIAKDKGVSKSLILRTLVIQYIKDNKQIKLI